MNSSVFFMVERGSQVGVSMNPQQRTPKQAPDESSIIFKSENHACLRPQVFHLHHHSIALTTDIKCQKTQSPLVIHHSYPPSSIYGTIPLQEDQNPRNFAIRIPLIARSSSLASRLRSRV